VVKIIASPRSKYGIFDLTLNKIEHFETGSSFYLPDIRDSFQAMRMGAYYCPFEIFVLLDPKKSEIFKRK